MTHYVLPANEVREVLARAKQAAVDYYRLTGKPLGVTGEVGEYEAARLLGLSLVAARVPGHDATDDAGLRYQIKSRAVPDPKRANSQRLGSIKPAQEWDVVLLVLMNQALDTQEIWKAERDSVLAALAAPGIESARVLRTWLFDPAITVQENIVGPDGRVTTTEASVPSSASIGVALTSVVTLRPSGVVSTISSARTVSAR